MDRIDKYIDAHTANAHDMDDSNPDKKYYQGWDDALGKIAGILQDVYSGEKQKEQPKEELVYRLNGLMQDYIKEGKDEEEREHRFKCYKLFWDALEEAEFFEQKKQKPAECIKTEELAEHIKAEFESFRNLLKKKGIDYQPAEVYWTDFARLFVSSAKKLYQPAEWREDYREEDIQTRFAFYTYKDDSSVLYLSNVFVEEASRNHGFGTKILKAAEKAAEAVGATTICLKVKQDSPANAWYRKRGYGYITFEDDYDWLEKNLEYLKPKKEVEWSEEDENWSKYLLDELYAGLKDYCGAAEEDMKKAIKWFETRLKSLRSRPKSSDNWKPSEEQMDSLRDTIIQTKGYSYSRYLPELYEQLRKL